LSRIAALSIISRLRLSSTQASGLAKADEGSDCTQASVVASLSLDFVRSETADNLESDNANVLGRGCGHGDRFRSVKTGIMLNLRAPKPTKGRSVVFDFDDDLVLVVADSALSNDLVVVVMMMTRVVVMISPVIGHGVSNDRASDAAHHRTDRPANNSAGDGAADPSSDRTGFVGKDKLS
jgi:hypothetical protein